VRVSLVRVGKVFLGMTAALVVLALLHVWGVLALPGETLVRIGATYLLVSVLLGVHAIVSTLRDEGPRNQDGERLVD
jgi:hypothetical protein